MHPRRQSQTPYDLSGRRSKVAFAGENEIGNPRVGSYHFAVGEDDPVQPLPRVAEAADRKEVAIATPATRFRDEPVGVDARWGLDDVLLAEGANVLKHGVVFYEHHVDIEKRRAFDPGSQRCHSLTPRERGSGLTCELRLPLPRGCCRCLKYHGYARPYYSGSQRRATGDHLNEVVVAEDFRQLSARAVPHEFDLDSVGPPMLHAIIGTGRRPEASS